MNNASVSYYTGNILSFAVVTCDNGFRFPGGQKQLNFQCLFDCNWETIPSCICTDFLKLIYTFDFIIFKFLAV